MDELKHIKRHDYPRCHGWNFRIYNGGVSHSRLFSDGVYGGSKQALNAAIAYSKEYYKTHTVRTVFYHTRSKKSKTTRVGLSLCCKKDGVHLLAVGWLASLMIDNQQRKSYFSIIKWGYKGAYTLARNARLTYTHDETTPIDPPPPPNWLISFLKDRHIKIHL